MLYVENLHKSYQIGKEQYEVLKGIDLSVAKGEFVAVMGPSGSGKSTLLNCMSCYIPYEEGKVVLGGQEIKGINEKELANIRNKKLGFVFQDFMLLDGLSIYENILVPKIIQGKVRRKEEQRAEMLMEMFGITHIKNKYPAEVSGGERQRTAVARALINDPLIILADEPTGNLDSKSSNKVISSFQEAREKLNATIFMVTHDSFAASHCDRVILLKDGMVYQNMQKKTTSGKFQDELLLAIKEMSEVKKDDLI